LGLPRTEDLPVDEPLRQLGLDSLMAVELRNLLGKTVAETLPATVTFDHPSVAALVEFLASGTLAAELAPAAAPAETAPAAPESSNTGVFDALDEDELARLLMNRLDQLGPQEAL
ncbi:MAG: acyl carrier protein, partial [Rhodocyclaceae bacterium]